MAENEYYEALLLEPVDPNCPKCGAPVPVFDHGRVQTKKLSEDLKCPKCGEKLLRRSLFNSVTNFAGVCINHANEGEVLSVIRLVKSRLAPWLPPHLYCNGEL